MPKPEPIDILISYKSEQFSWAKRLADSLREYNFRVFLDHDLDQGLEAGKPWEPQLMQAIHTAKYMIVLWSKLISAQSYVITEIQERQKVNKSIVVARLDNTPTTQSLGNTGIQDFLDFKFLYQKSASGEGKDAEKKRQQNANTVNFFEWNDAVKHLVESSLSEGQLSFVVVPVIVVAMTRTQAETLPANLENRTSLFERLSHYMSKTTPFDPHRYGSTSEEWRPFDDFIDPAQPNKPMTIQEIIRQHDSAKRRWVRQTLKIDYVNDERINRVFLSYTAALADPSTYNEVMQQLAWYPSLMVIDPISLLHREVRDFFSQTGLNGLANTFTIGVSPFIPSMHADLRDYAQVLETEMINTLYFTPSFRRFRSYFEPSLSLCVMNVDQGYQLTRWLQLATDNIVNWGMTLRMKEGYDHIDGPDVLLNNWG